MLKTVFVKGDELQRDSIPENLTKIAVDGAKWTAISQIATQGFQFIITATLARLLFPEDFGIVGMAAIFSGLAIAVNELGLSAAIIQRKQINNSHLTTSFWASLFMGILIFIFSFIAAPFLADFFDKEIVAPIIIILSISFMIGPLGVIHRSLLSKKMSFKKLAIVEIGATAISGSAAVIMAFTGFGVWSLVCRSILTTIIATSILWIVCPWRPSMHFSYLSFKQLFRFSINVTGNQIVDYIRHNMDYLIIAKILGAASLGLYSLAYRIVMIPRDKISPIVKQVSFPLFSSIQDDNAKIRFGYLKQISYLSLVTFPLLAGLFCVAPEFVKVIYGEKWIPTILPLQILCFSGMTKSLGSTVGSILLSKGRPDIELKWNSAMFITLTIFLIVGAQFGVAGVASAIAILSIIVFPIFNKIVNRLIDLSFKKYLSALYPAAYGSLIMVVFIYLLKTIMLKVFHQNDIIVLICSIASGAIVYFTFLKIARVKVLDELLQHIKSMFNPHHESMSTTE